VPVLYYNGLLEKTEGNLALRAPIDLFGGLVGKVVPPDEKMPTPRPDARMRESPRVARNRAMASYSKAWEGVGPRRSQDQAIVVMQPEMADLANTKGDMHKHAKDLTLAIMPTLVQEAADAEAKLIFGSVEKPEDCKQQYGETADGQAGLTSPRIKPIAIPPRQNVQANPDGILPPNSGRHEGRTDLDRYFSVRQTFPVRKPHPPSKFQMEKTQRIAQETRADKKERADGLDIDFHDYSREPTFPEDLNRKAVQKSIRSKLHWGRYEQLGASKFVERRNPFLVAVAECRHANPEKDYNKLIKKEVKAQDYAVRKSSSIAMLAAKEREKMKLVTERRNILIQEHENWKYSIAEKFDVELQRAAALAQERARRQQTWVSIQVIATQFMAFSHIIAIGREKRALRRLMEEKAMKIQHFMSAKIMAHRIRVNRQMLDEIIKRLKPIAHFFIIKWRAKRRFKSTNVVRQFLKEVIKTNQVKRRISHFIHNVRRLQRVWRSHLRRQRAYMLVLSRQWDRALLLLRSKGKQGLLSDVSDECHKRNKEAFGVTPALQRGNAGVVVPDDKKQIKNDAGENKKDSAKNADAKRVSTGHTVKLNAIFKRASSQDDDSGVDIYERLREFHDESTNLQTHPTTQAPTSTLPLTRVSKHGHQSGGYLGHLWEHRLQEHNKLHVHFTAKSLSMLSRIVHYPVIKWQKLRFIYRQRRQEHIDKVRKYLEDIVQYRQFVERKQNVEKVIMAFAQNEEDGHEMAKKLLGDQFISEQPKEPRVPALISPVWLQKCIEEGLQRLVHTSSKLREEAAAADAFLKASVLDTNPEFAYRELTPDMMKLHNIHHHKPWWVCHETYWNNFHEDPDVEKPDQLEVDKNASKPGSGEFEFDLK
jgi:hypothetical protein